MDSLDCNYNAIADSDPSEIQWSANYAFCLAKPVYAVSGDTLTMAHDFLRANGTTLDVEIPFDNPGRIEQIQPRDAAFNRGSLFGISKRRQCHNIFGSGGLNRSDL